MSLTTDSNRVVATGDNSTTDFAFNRLLYDEDHLQVYLDGVLQTTGYTVTGVPGTSTSVTFTPAPGTDVQVLLLRVVPITQLSVYAVGGAFPAATTEKNFDLTVMGLQQFDEALGRAVTLPVNSTLTAANLPDPADPDNYGMGIKIAGDGSGLDTFEISATPFSSVVTTKGDIAIFGASAVDRLPVGTNNKILTADSAVARGVKWSATAKLGDASLFGYTDNTSLQVYGDLGTPSTIQQLTRFVSQSLGDNTTFIGAAAGYFEARDKSTVSAGTKGVLYALSLSVVPSVARNNVPYDDVDGLTISNTTGTAGAKATDAIYLSNNNSIFPSSSEWFSGITIDANVDVGFRLGGRIATFGIDLALATYVTGVAIRLKNASSIYSRNGGDSADYILMNLDADNIINLGQTGVGVKTASFFASTVPRSVTATPATVVANDTDLIVNFAGTVTLTLPVAASFPGRILVIRTVTANTVVSASSNVVPLIGGSAGTAILAAAAGTWASLKSDGANWQIMMGN